MSPNQELKHKVVSLHADYSQY